jgi:hypothetical protein
MNVGFRDGITVGFFDFVGTFVGCSLVIDFVGLGEGTGRFEDPPLLGVRVGLPDTTGLMVGDGIVVPLVKCRHGTARFINRECTIAGNNVANRVMTCIFVMLMNWNCSLSKMT